MKIEPSTRKDKRFMDIFKNCQIVHFGSKNGSTYIENCKSLICK